MKLAALFSGGKDSTYSIYKAKREGHQIECLVTVSPLSDESLLLHYHNIQLTKLQSNSMIIPQIYTVSNSNDPNFEVNSLERIVGKAKEDFGIEGIVHGGIQSEFQKKHFEKICSNLNLTLYSPLWNKNQKEYMKDLIDSKFHFIIVSVTSEGLGESWLGKEITKKDLDRLEKLAIKHGFNLNFEGGEAETLVIDCPLFSHPIKIEKARKIWDGYRGRYEILDARLDYTA